MIIARLVSNNGWYAEVFNTDAPERNYTEEEEQQAQIDTCGNLQLNEIYAQCTAKADTVAGATANAKQIYPSVKFTDWGTFELALSKYVFEQARIEREKKIASGWSPFDTGVKCVQKKCDGKVQWDSNPEFSHGSDAPWGQIVHSWAHCKQCYTVYGTSYEIGATYLNSKEPLPKRWFYIENGQSYTFDPQGN